MEKRRVAPRCRAGQALCRHLLPLGQQDVSLRCQPIKLEVAQDQPQLPEGLTPDRSAAAYADDPRARGIATAAARLNDLREAWRNPPDLVRRVPEVVPGHPDHPLPVSEAAAKELKKRTLTNLYNTRPAWLAHAHAALDAAVADAYGWADDWRAGTLSDDEILARLFRPNQPAPRCRRADGGAPKAPAAGTIPKPSGTKRRLAGGQMRGKPRDMIG
ncbi:MAG: hypothetical protein ACXIUV_14125 [Alkalilacustris sp.]